MSNGGVFASLGNQLSKALHNLGNSILVDDQVVDTFINEVNKCLLKSDVNVHLVRKLENDLRASIANVPKAHNKRKLLEKTLIHSLCALLSASSPVRPAAPPPFVNLSKLETTVILMVGLQGAGKTTTATKVAHYYHKRGYRAGLICADTFRAGAFDQLKQNASKAHIPFYGSYTETDPVVIAEAGLDLFRKEKFNVIIVDSSGRHCQDQALFEELRALYGCVQPQLCVLVMDSSIGQSASQQAQAFKECVPVHSVIMTKMDSHCKAGGALSAVVAAQCSISFIGTGEHIDQLERFDAQAYVGRLLGRGDLQGLFQRLNNQQEQGQQREQLAKKLLSGKPGDTFTPRDFGEVMMQMEQMGPIGNVLSMIPGGHHLLAQHTSNKLDDLTKNVKRHMIILQSMHTSELDKPGIEWLKKSFARQVRIARGSGSSLEQLQEFIQAFAQFKTVQSKLAPLLIKQQQQSPQKLLSSLMSSGGNLNQFLSGSKQHRTITSHARKR